MRFELTNDKLLKARDMARAGYSLRRIAKSLKVSESTLRWQIARMGYEYRKTGDIVPIHASVLDTNQAA